MQFSKLLKNSARHVYRVETRTTTAHNSNKRYAVVVGVARCGGARRDRTADLLLAKQALSQLSYGPLSEPNRRPLGLCHQPASGWLERVVGLGRVELPTSPLSGVRSNQ